MRDAFLAVTAATDVRAHARTLRRTWDATFSGAAVAATVRPVIARSWSRMSGAGLDPRRMRPRSVLGPDELAHARVTSPLRATLPALRRHLAAVAEDAEHIMVVGDAQGRVLWIEGHPRVLEQAEAISFRAGMLWTEHSAGTNAIGTALAIAHPVQVFSAEHFLPEQHPWWCSAAPLHDPATGDLIGVIDVSGPQRTAHPYSLTLVTAAARIAEAILRDRQVARDELLRQAYLQRVRRSSGTASALVDHRGRVRLATPASWLSGTIDPPVVAGRLQLPDGDLAEAEALTGGAWVLWRLARRRAAGDIARRRLHVRLLGRHGHTVAVGESTPQRLSLRQAEAVALLVMHPYGLDAEELRFHLYGDEGKRVSVRALMSRLRTALGDCLVSRPYRLIADVRADFVAVQELLDAGETERAQRLYRGPLLPDSDVEGIATARATLSAAVRRAALDGTTHTIWSWLATDDGRDDPDAMRAFLQLADERDARREVIAARLHGGAGRRP